MVPAPLRQASDCGAHGAVARGIHGEVAVRVAAALRFDVTSFVDESFHEIFVQITALQRIMIHVETAAARHRCARA